MLTGVNRLKTTGRHGSQVEDAIPPTSTGAVCLKPRGEGWGLGLHKNKTFTDCEIKILTTEVEARTCVLFGSLSSGISDKRKSV